MLQLFNSSIYQVLDMKCIQVYLFCVKASSTGSLHIIAKKLNELLDENLIQTLILNENLSKKVESLFMSSVFCIILLDIFSCSFMLTSVKIFKQRLCKTHSQLWTYFSKESVNSFESEIDYNIAQWSICFISPSNQSRSLFIGN